MTNNEETVVKFIKLYEDSIAPTHGSVMAAGYDLYSHEDATIPPHNTIKIGTGVAIQPPKGTFGAIFARSGLATKEGLRPANCVGVADEDYTGEYIVALHNDMEEVRRVAVGDRIAQVVFIPYVNARFEEAIEFAATERGDNGFGSTGV